MARWIEQMIDRMGYLGLALLTFVENIFPPLPSEVILPLGGFLAAQGKLTVVGVILAGTAGSVIGAVGLYQVGAYFNEDRLKRWVDQHSGWLLLTVSDVESAFGWFDRHGGKAVFLCRLIPGIRSLISLPAGARGMSMRAFLLYTTLGTAMWSGCMAYVGRMLGQQYTEVGLFLQWTTYAIIALLILSISWWWFQRRRETGQ